jgi:prepilin-type N-terminal cleavage/methylation domain-containing protein
MFDMKNTRGREKKSEGFSLIETLVGVALVAIAMLGLAQLMILSIANNAQADRMSSATFLARQQIEQLRLLTIDELNAQVGAPIDEQLDINLDGVFDYRRITLLQTSGISFQAQVMIFAAEQMSESVGNLTTDPQKYRVRANITSIISR